MVSLDRLIFVPQLPVQMRYQEWWFSMFPEMLRRWFSEVVVLGEGRRGEHLEAPKGGFSVVDEAIRFELRQVGSFMEMDLRSTDCVLLADLSFPGIFPNVLYHTNIGSERCFAICHATSRNSYDYFMTDRTSKMFVERGHSRLFKKVFVATEYSKNKLRGWDNVVSLGALPNPPFSMYAYNTYRPFDIVSVARRSRQKVTKGTEAAVERRFGHIHRPNSGSWTNYYGLLSRSKVLLVTAKEECYGYQCADAVLNGCIPVAPRKYSYPELLPDAYLYSDTEELFVLLERVLQGGMEVPKLLNQERIESFFGNLCWEMLE